MPHWHSALLTMTFLGLQQGIFKNKSQLPILANAPPELSSGEPALKGEGVPAGCEGPRSVKDSNREVDKFKGKCCNQIHAASCVLGNRMQRNLVCMMLRVVAKTRLAHGLALQQTESPAGCLQWWCAQAAGEWRSELSGALGALEDQAALLDIGFDHECFTDEPPISLPEDGELAGYMAAIVLELVSARLQSLFFLGTSLPGKLAGLLHSDAAVKQQTLEYLRAWFSTLQAAEDTGTIYDIPYLRAAVVFKDFVETKATHMAFLMNNMFPTSKTCFNKLHVCLLRTCCKPAAHKPIHLGRISQDVACVCGVPLSRKRPWPSRAHKRAG